MSSAAFAGGTGRLEPDDATVEVILAAIDSELASRARQAGERRPPNPWRFSARRFGTPPAVRRGRPWRARTA